MSARTQPPANETSRRILRGRDPLLPARAGALRPDQRARFLRRRLRRRHEEPQVACDRREGPADPRSISTIAARSGADPMIGDGCGMLMQIPHGFFAPGMREARLRPARARPLRGRPVLHAARRRPRARRCERSSNGAVADEGQMVLGWRDVPVDSSMLGERVKAVEPAMQPGLHRPRRTASPTRTPSSAGSTSSAR